MLLSTQDAEKNREYLLNGLIAAGAGFVGLTAILGLAALFGAGRVYDAFVLCMYALAAFSVGGLIGFIFGIPRSLQQRAAGAQGAPVETNSRQLDEASTSTRAPTVSTNTNLEDVSDWLTKILVGVGLTQAANLWREFGEVSKNLAQGFGSPMRAGPLIGAVLITFFVMGFVVGYLVTRLVLTKAFSEVNRELLQQQLVGTLMSAQEAALAVDEPQDAVGRFSRRETFENLRRMLQHLPKARRMDSQKTLTRSFLKVKAVTISEIKQMLHDLKCYFGNIDDVFDDALIEAVQAFQESEGLPADGVLAISTYTHLKNRTEGG